MAAEKGRENVLYIHVPLVVSIPGTGELKSKPTQHSVQGAAVRRHSAGYSGVPHATVPLPEDMRRKIALFCNMEEDCVIQNLTASTLYEVPLLLEREGLCRGGLPEAGTAGSGSRTWPSGRPWCSASTGCTRPCDDCPGGQVYRPARCVSQRGGVPVPRRERPATPG